MESAFICTIIEKPPSTRPVAQIADLYIEWTRFLSPGRDVVSKLYSLLETPEIYYPICVAIENDAAWEWNDSFERN